MKMNYTYKIAAIAATAMLSSGLSHAALTTASFTDAGFEDAGAVTPDDGKGNTVYDLPATSYNVTSALTSGDPFSGTTIDEGKWNVHAAVNLRSNALVANNNYRGGTTVPANASGSYFFTGSRAYNQNRGIMQFVSDGAATTGSITLSIDYWVRELNQATAAGTSDPVSIAFEVFAFNNLADVTFTSADSATDPKPLDVIQYIGTGGFVSVGGTFADYDSVSTTTGFQTLERTLNLGTGYQYVGVSISNYGQDARNANSGAVASFDNLQVVPEPSTALLGGLGALLLLRRRRI